MKDIISKGFIVHLYKGRNSKVKSQKIVDLRVLFDHFFEEHDQGDEHYQAEHTDAYI